MQYSALLRFLSKFRPSRPFIFILLVYCLGIVFFAFFRFLFYLNFIKQFSDTNFIQIIHAFIIGVRFDQIMVLFILTPLIFLLPWLKKTTRAPYIITLAYLTIAFSFVFFLLLLDIRFYSIFDSHLNFNVIDYAQEGRTTWNLVLTDPKFYFFIAIGLATTACFLVGLIAVRKFTHPVIQRRSWLNTGIYFIFFLIIFFLGIRGRTKLSPIDWGMAYFSKSHLLNQLPLNGAYSLARTIIEKDNDPRLSYKSDDERFPFVPFSTALDTAQSMLVQKGDSLLQPDKNLLRRTTQPDNDFSFRPNVVIVVMESWSGRNTGALGSRRNLTPYFDSLASHGILFTNFFASGTRTAYGLSAVLCSYPSLPGRAILKRYHAEHPFVTLSEILANRGYTNVFVYGGDIAFDNMGGFFRSKKYDLIYSEEELGNSDSFSKWGIPDHIVFDKTVSITDSLPRPFQISIMTLSNHEPFHLPDSSVQRYMDDSDSSKIFNCQIYADWALGQFIKSFANKPVFDSTIFVFTADHCKYIPSHYIIDPINFHIPLLIYSPALLGDSGRRIDTYSGQTDILPTLMHLLGGNYIHTSWGRDLFRLAKNDNGFAYYNNLHHMAYIDSSFYYMESLPKDTALLLTSKLYKPDAEITDKQPQDLHHIQHRMRYYIQTAEQLSFPQQK